LRRDTGRRGTEESGLGWGLAGVHGGRQTTDGELEGR